MPRSSPQVAGRRNVTIKDVAKRARVSPMSVSNYLNERFHLMAADTRARITTAIAALGYRPNSGARGLRLNKEFSVGMIIVDPQPAYLVDPFISRVASGLSSRLAEMGYACTVQGLPDCGATNALFASHFRADALCVFASGKRAARRRLIESLARYKEPIVLIEETERFPRLDLMTVRQDDGGGAEQIAHHLLSLGARSFLLMMPKPIWPANVAREITLTRLLTEAVGPQRVARITCGYGNFTAVQKVLGRWLATNKPVDAFVANNDQIGIAALRTLVAHGIGVPSDAMVTGFGGFEIWHYSDPPLTTVVSRAYELGQYSAEAIIERLKSGRFPEREVVLPLMLQVSGSTASCP
ncbi:MAG: LacI family DNA-binding transcriptional regulator [Alphaproteobacteria bacterium]|nr:LacI family DNA-binding transcriptional regulator [Alphaproteobacteria bacterium]